MNTHESVAIKRLAAQASSIDSIANWFIELILAMEAPKQASPEGISIGRPVVQGSKFRVQAHHQEFACFYGHTIGESGLSGRFEIVKLNRDSTLGETIFVFRATNEAIIFPDETGFAQYFLSQEQYDHVRSQTAYQLMGAIQRQLLKH
ncbi:hypothetical protein HH212_26265 [Massilia forsythiae]|uniref:Uncharacterized protein n=1 Tax=Massilia forsythiae TaxID=2728020 RepID=A0A7Z2W1H8_9BURK|nr:hypothetical protein [Massilia forsythiae]QJE03063.1 hypothetical protein HH212_26265 [Massilia forsythiae]